MHDIDEMIKEEWRNIGFYCELDESANPPEWKIYGSKQGLLKFVKLLTFIRLTNAMKFFQSMNITVPTVISKL